MTKQLLLSLALGLCSLSAVADGTTLPKGNDVTAEKAAQNTPEGWTAVSLPNIPNTCKTVTVNGLSETGTAAYNASVIQAALDAVDKTNGTMVVIPAGTYLCNPISIRVDKTILHLSAGTTLKLPPYGGNTTSPAADCYPIRTKTDGSSTTYSFDNFINNLNTTSGTTELHDIIIEGEGVTSIIEGQGGPWWDASEKNTLPATRPSLIRLTKGSRFLFRNFRMQNSPGTNLTLGQGGGASDMTAHDITIENPSSTAKDPSHNTDGIPVWGPQVNIYDCNISTGDDNVVCDSRAQYVHAWNIICGAGHGMSIGSNTEQLNHIIYEGITFNNTEIGLRIKSARGKSGNSYSGTEANGAVGDIIFRNITMTGVLQPILLTEAYDGEKSDPSDISSAAVTYQTPEFTNVLFQNIKSTGTAYNSHFMYGDPIFIYGLPESYIHGITFDNVSVESQKGMYLAYCKDISFTNGCKITMSAIDKAYEAATPTGSYDGTTTATTYTVNFISDGTTYKTETVCPNSYAYAPTAPVKAGYTFLGWAATEGGEAVSVAATQITSDAAFYALWKENGSIVTEETIFSLTYTTDVKVSASSSLSLSDCSTITGGSGIIFNNRTDVLDTSSKKGLYLGGSGGSYIKITLDKALKTGDILTTTGGDGGEISSSTTVTNADNISGNKFTFTSSFEGLKTFYIYRGTSKPTITAIKVTRQTETTPQYTITVSGENGTVAIEKSDGTLVESGSKVDNGTTLILTATAADGYEFAKWSDDNTENPRAVIIDGADVTLTAQFTSMTLSNKYAVTAGETVTDTKAITRKDISMTYGNDTWNAGIADDNMTKLGYAYPAYIGGSNSPLDGNGKKYSDSGNPPTTGCYYVFNPTKNGSLSVYAKITSNKATYVTENSTAIGFTLKGESHVSGYAPASSYYGDITFPVTAGKTYYVFCIGSKLALYGWEFTPQSTPTEISAVRQNVSAAAEKIYTLQGVEVANPVKGHIYIKNGKKLIMK